MKRLLFFMMSMLIATVAFSRSAVQEKKAYGGTLRWGVHTQPTGINPITTTNSVSVSLMGLVFNNLVRLNAQGEAIPDLAESWDVSDGGLVYTFHLKKRVRFHDGTECTADDVKFTYEMFVKPQNRSPFASSFQLVREFRAVDRYTFQIILKKPYAQFIYRLTREIVPKHLLEKEDILKSPFNRHPVGTGPFRFKEWNKDNQIILEFNPDYFEGRPFLDRIIIRPYPTLHDVWSALMRREVDLALFLNREDYETVKNDATFKAYSFPSDFYYALVHNPDDEIFADKRIRQAIAYGIDRKQLIKRIAHGYGVESTGPFYPHSFGFNEQVSPYVYDPETAARLLQQAGWQDVNNDGILEKEGRNLRLRVLVDTRDAMYQRIIMELRQQLQEIGIEVEAIPYNRDEMLTKDFLSKTATQAHLTILFSGTDPDQVLEDWYSKIPQRPDKLWQYRNERVDALFELGASMLDVKEREKIYQVIHKEIYEDQSVCFLFFPFYFHAVNSKFGGIDAFFNINMQYYMMKDWFFKGN